MTSCESADTGREITEGARQRGERARDRETETERQRQWCERNSAAATAIAPSHTLLSTIHHCRRHRHQRCSLNALQTVLSWFVHSPGEEEESSPRTILFAVHFFPPLINYLVIDWSLVDNSSIWKTKSKLKGHHCTCTSSSTVNVGDRH